MSLREVGTGEILGPSHVLAAKGHAGKDWFARACLGPIMKGLVGLELRRRQRKRSQVDPALPRVGNQAVFHPIRAIACIDDEVADLLEFGRRNIARLGCQKCLHVRGIAGMLIGPLVAGVAGGNAVEIVRKALRLGQRFAPARGTTEK